MKKIIDKAAALIEALPYFQQFRNEIVVIKFGGSAMECPELTKNTMRDIVFMECVGMRPVVVHGGGKAITAALKEQHIETHFVHGLRYTCEKVLEVVDDVLHNEVNDYLAKVIEEAGGKGRRISGKDIITALKSPAICPESSEKIDVGFVGEVHHIDTSTILETVKNDILPIVTPLGCDLTTGHPLNINADIAACKVAEALKARKLVFLSDVPGILRDKKDQSSLISTIKVSEVDYLIKRGAIGDGMIPKIRSAIHALEVGTNKVHLIDGRIQHSLLLEIFTDSGVGTQIIKD